MNLNTWAGIVSAVIAGGGFIIDHWQAASGFVLDYVWQRLFVNIWFVWVGLFVYGLFKSVQFLKKLYQTVKVNDKLLAFEMEQRKAQYLAATKDRESVATLVSKLSGKIEDISLDRAVEDTSLALRLNKVEAEVKRISDCIPDSVKGSPTPSVGAAALPGRLVMNEGRLEFLR